MASWAFKQVSKMELCFLKISLLLLQFIAANNLNLKNTHLKESRSPYLFGFPQNNLKIKHKYKADEGKVEGICSGTYERV